MDYLEALLRRVPAPPKNSKRPYCTLAYAQSLDGSIDIRRGSSLRLSSPEAMTFTHRLRAAHDAILVGIGTVLADDPQLTVRLVEGEDPQPVIVDSRLRFPLNAQLLDNPDKPPWIATSERALPERQAVLEAAGARIFRIPVDSDDHVELVFLSRRLFGLGIKSLMVEGGTRIITSFLAARLVDRIVLTITPFMVGGLRAVDSLMHSELKDVARIGSLNFQPLGSDLLVWGDLTWEKE